jgi:IS30 family transposase
MTAVKDAECRGKVTSNNGQEFAGHEEMAEQLEADFYFSVPIHPGSVAPMKMQIGR